MWYEGNPCNMHLLLLAEEVKKGVEEAGLVGFRFNTVGVSDAISMGTNGMSYSLQSRCVQGPFTAALPVTYLCACRWPLFAGLPCFWHSMQHVSSFNKEPASHCASQAQRWGHAACKLTPRGAETSLQTAWRR